MSNFPDKFLNNEGKIQPELLEEQANNVAKDFEQAGMTTHQVRKFFDEVKKYKIMLDRFDTQRKKDKQKSVYVENKPFIFMLKSKAKNAAIRDNKMNEFYRFIDNSIGIIKNSSNIEEEMENFKAFCYFFEAIYGFAQLKSQ